MWEHYNKISYKVLLNFGQNIEEIVSNIFYWKEIYWLSVNLDKRNPLMRKQ